MKAREIWPDRVKRRFTIFKPNKDAQHSGELWEPIRTVTSNRLLDNELKYLEEIGYTGDIRVTITTTHVLKDTVKGIDKMTGWKPSRRKHEEEK